MKHENFKNKMRTDEMPADYYPYIPNSDIISLVLTMLKYNCKSIADLGCGEAHVLSILNSLRFKIMGVEVIKDYIKVAKKLLPLTVNIVHKDIFDLNHEELRIHNAGWEYSHDIRQFERPDVLYFYAPVFSKETAYRFINQIIHLARPGQYIFHKAAGNNMRNKLKEFVKREILIELEGKGIWVYKKLNTKTRGNSNFKLII